VAKVDLALQYAADLPAEELRALFELRTTALRTQMSAWHEQWREAEPHLVGLEALTFAHTALRLEVEIAYLLDKSFWHQVGSGNRLARSGSREAKRPCGHAQIAAGTKDAADRNGSRPATTFQVWPDDNCNESAPWRAKGRRRMNDAQHQPTFSDEKQIRGLFEQMLESWERGAAPYAECFAPDASYIVGTGMLQEGWQEIVDGHEIIFSGWARNSRLEGRIHGLRFLTEDVATITAYGHIVYKDHRSSGNNKRTIYTIIARKRDGRWQFVSYQNPPLLGH
jgi:uncharacterized protein (TIGR02246 family)